MTRWVAVVSVSLLFVVGIAIGAMATHLGAGSLIHRSGGTAKGPGGFVRHLERELDLTPDQLRAFEEILDESRGAGERLRAEMEPRVREHIEQTRARMESVLTPEQQQRFEELHARHRRNAELWMLGSGFGPGHPRRHHRAPRPNPPDGGE